MGMKQSEAVTFFTMQVLGDAFQAEVAVESYITKEQKSEIVDLVTDSILEGETEMKEASRAKYADRGALRSKYVAGMVKNWFQKGKNLNGNVKHEYKNPGSRAGRGDGELKALKTLRAQIVDLGGDAEKLARVDEHIERRTSELAIAKPKAVIDVNLIPADLQDLVAS